jgi:hypothetical protein
MMIRSEDSIGGPGARMFTFESPAALVEQDETPDAAEASGGVVSGVVGEVNFGGALS